MNSIHKVVVLGMGDIGRPLFEIVKGVYPRSLGYDPYKLPAKLPMSCDVMHVCFPYSEKFVYYVVNYYRWMQPSLVLIESTIPPGTTRKIADEIPSANLAHSPVRGRRADGFKKCYYDYTKFIGAISRDIAFKASLYYQSLGFRTYVCSSEKEAEFLKLIDLSYFGLMLAWNQEMRRMAAANKFFMHDIIAFLETNGEESGKRFPRPVYDGKPIGGHCVIPAVEMLKEEFPSDFLDAIIKSNDDMILRSKKQSEPSS